jgi:hypothetical protein
MGLPINSSANETADRQGQQVEGLVGAEFQRHTNRKRSLFRRFTKWVFPGDTRSQRRKKIKFLLVAAGLGLFLGLLIIIVEWMKSF